MPAQNLKELHGMGLVHEILLLSLACQDQTPELVLEDFNRKYMLLIHSLDTSATRDAELVSAVEAAYRRISAQLLKHGD